MDDPDFDKIKTPKASEQSSDPLNDIWGPLMQTAGEQLKSHETTMVFSGSTTLSEATHNKMMQTMVVRFKRTPGAYTFFNVPANVAEELFACEASGASAGKYFVKNIKNVYPFSK